MQSHSNSRPFVSGLLIFLNAFLGFSALIPGAAFILAPDGHLIRMPLSNLENAPFADYLVPGILLFVFIGVYPALVAYSLWKRPAWGWPNTLNPFKQFHWSWAASLAVSVILIIWIIVEVQFMTVGFLHVFYFAWGALILVVTLLRGVREYYTLGPEAGRLSTGKPAP